METPVIWIQVKKMEDGSVTSQFICNRARGISEVLKCKSPQSSIPQFEEFEASKGWLGMGWLPMQ
jgi:hypothetical protein